MVAEPQEAPPAARPTIAFLGFVDAGSGRQALLRGSDGAELWRVLGSEIEGWRLAAIDSKQVLFVYNDERFSIPLYRDTAEGDFSQ